MAAEMNNVREKLSQTRELCKGMPEEVYALTDYMSIIAKDSLVPAEMVLMFVLVLDDIQQERVSFPNAKSKEFLQVFMERKNQVLEQAVYFVQVIDEIADSEAFVQEFRYICKEMLGFDPPKRVTKENEDGFPPFIQVAVDWWANAIEAGTHDNRDDGMPIFLFSMECGTVKTFSDEEMALFRKALAESIMLGIERWNSCTITIAQQPCRELVIAGNKLGINSITVYPGKITMDISRYEIKVSVGLENKTLWTSN